MFPNNLKSIVLQQKRLLTNGSIEDSYQSSSVPANAYQGQTM